MRNLSARRRALAAGSMLLICSLMTAGCAATRVTRVWEDESYQGGRLNNVLIIVFVTDPTARRMFESEFAKQFKRRGIDAIESFRDPEMDKLEGNESRSVIMTKIHEQRIAAVLMTRVVAVRREEDTIPGMTISAGFGTVGMGYAFTGPSAPTTQGYSHEDKFLGLETNLYHEGTEKLLWSVRSETRISASAMEEIKPYVAIISRQLFETNLFP